MAAPHRLRLHLLNGEIQFVDLTTSRTVIGRTRGDVCIEDIGVQDPHLELWLVGTHYFLKPIGPTGLEGRPVTEKVPLQVGSIVTLGSTSMQLIGPVQTVPADSSFPVGKAFF